MEKENNKILGLIPARYASTRFPGKPLAEIAGKPMIQWVYERASRVFEHLYVATDDQRIAEAVWGFGGRIIMTSAKHPSGTDRCAEALSIAEKETGLAFEVVVNIQGDEPFIQPEQLKLVTEPFSKPKVQIATLVKPFGATDNIFNPNTPKVVVGTNGNALYFSRSAIPFIRGSEQHNWAKTNTFYKHIGLYAYRSNVLNEITKLRQSPLETAESLEQLRWLENGYSIAVSITEMETLAVDTPEDLERVKEYAASTLNKPNL
jgi:3-deoxy-manno-octulosonate cytidylyltransferase (CMP-KDO synthetase)